MADTFLARDVANLLFKKRVLMFGCSNMRAMYKDLLWLYSSNTLIENSVLRKKLESSFLGDRLISSSTLTKSRHFVEQRIFKQDNIHIEFHFLTRCYCPTIVEILTAIKEKKKDVPDVILINSTLWDLCRWGPNGINEFKTNLVKLMELCTSCLPDSTLVIWSTALPVHSTIRGGLIIKQIEFMQQSLRFNLMEANLYSKNIVQKYGYDILDLHYHMNLQVSRRSCDGVHYLPLPLRLMTNLFLTHLALTWGSDLPMRCVSLLLKNELKLSQLCSQSNNLGTNASNSVIAVEPLRVNQAKRKKRAKRNNLKKKNLRSTEDKPSHAEATLSSNNSNNHANKNNKLLKKNNSTNNQNQMMSNNNFCDGQLQSGISHSQNNVINGQVQHNSLNQAQINNIICNVNPFAKYYL